MSLAQLLKQSATVRRRGPGTADDLGNQPQVVTQEVTYSVYAEPGAITTVRGTGGREITIDRNTELQDITMIFPPNAILDHDDTVLYDGKEWHVIGPPGVRFDMSGPHHIEAVLRFVR